jgi:hypothetical protein
VKLTVADDDTSVSVKYRVNEPDREGVLVRPSAVSVMVRVTVELLVRVSWREAPERVSVKESVSVRVTFSD